MTAAQSVRFNKSNRDGFDDRFGRNAGGGVGDGAALLAWFGTAMDTAAGRARWHQVFGARHFRLRPLRGRTRLATHAGWRDRAARERSRRGRGAAACDRAFLWRGDRVSPCDVVALCAPGPQPDADRAGAADVAARQLVL